MTDGTPNPPMLIKKIARWSDTGVKLLSVFMLVFLAASVVVSGVTLIKIAGVFACIGALIPD